MRINRVLNYIGAALITPLVSLAFLFAAYISPAPKQISSISGSYVLELFIEFPDGFIVNQLAVFNNAVHGFYQCNVERHNIMRRASAFIKQHNAKVICAKIYMGEI